MHDGSGNARRPLALYLLAGLLLFQGLSGLAGGIGLIGDPTGEAIGLPETWLEGSPFRDYLIPGVVLFLVLGVVPVIVAWAVWVGRERSWVAALMVGAGLMVWIAVQILVVGYQASPPLQAFYGSLGLVLVVLSMVGSVRRYTARSGSVDR
jgi:hypothetical protein